MGALDRLRTTFRGKAGHLDAAGLGARIGCVEVDGRVGEDPPIGWGPEG